jgi:hypothetical protein
VEVAENLIGRQLWWGMVIVEPVWRTVAEQGMSWCCMERQVSWRDWQLVWGWRIEFQILFFPCLLFKSWTHCPMIQGESLLCVTEDHYLPWLPELPGRKIVSLNCASVLPLLSYRG